MKPIKTNQGPALNRSTKEGCGLHSIARTQTINVPTSLPMMPGKPFLAIHPKDTYKDQHRCRSCHTIVWEFNLSSANPWNHGNRSDTRKYNLRTKLETHLNPFQLYIKLNKMKKYVNQFYNSTAIQTTLTHLLTLQANAMRKRGCLDLLH